MCIDFGKYSITPNRYSLRHGYDYDTHCLRNWKLEGSNDGNKWNSIKIHSNDRSINKGYQLHTWKISNCNQSFKMFRIYMNGENSSDNNHLMMSGFEVYGHLRC